MYRGRARLAIEQRHLAEVRAGGEANEALLAHALFLPARGDRKLRARTPADDDIELVFDGAFAEQDFAGGVLAPLEQRAKLLAFLGREAREQGELLERVFAARHLTGPQRPDQVVLGPLEGVVGVGERGAHRSEDSHTAKQD